MIIFEPSSGKNFILVILVVVAASIIVWQWAVKNPFDRLDQDNYFLSQMKDGTSQSVDALAGIKNAINENQEQIKVASDEQDKQNKQEQLINEAKKYLEDKSKDLSLVVPDNKSACEDKGGQWEIFGLSDFEQCNLPTTDFGQECLDSQDCQGYCFTESADIYEVASLQEPLEATGICSEDTIRSGKCIAFINEGKNTGQICID